MDEKELLKRCILEVFSKVPVPSENNITPHICCECDEIKNQFKNHTPVSIPESILANHVWDLPFFSEEAKRYYLSAWLIRSIDNVESDYTDAVITNLASNHRNNGYTQQQKSLIFKYLEWVALESEHSFDDAANAIMYWEK